MRYIESCSGKCENVRLSLSCINFLTLNPLMGSIPTGRRHLPHWRRLFDIEAKRDIRELFVYTFRLSRICREKHQEERKAKEVEIESPDAVLLAKCSPWNQTNHFRHAAFGDVCTFFRAELRRKVNLTFDLIPASTKKIK